MCGHCQSFTLESDSVHKTISDVPGGSGLGAEMDMIEDRHGDGKQFSTIKMPKF